MLARFKDGLTKGPMQKLNETDWQAKFASFKPNGYDEANLVV